MAYLRNRNLRGVYSGLNFPLPSNSLPMLPAVVAVVKAAANLAVKQNGGGRNGMAGAYGPQARRWPGAYSRRGMATLSGARRGMGAGMSDFTDWIKNNPLMAGGIGVGAVLRLNMGSRRR